MTISYAADGNRSHFSGEQKPLLRISNMRLLKSGFAVGSKIEVEFLPKKIIITKKDNLQLV
ncbi:MAG: hypothetical protein HYT94_04905 [Parcubacteria group bacterium]|nr:hypothetical protein [Parcubacteria group bacterium]